MNGHTVYELDPSQSASEQCSLWVQDVQNRDNNTAKSAFRYLEIKQLFRNAYTEIQDQLKLWQSQPPFTALQESASPNALPNNVVHKILM